MVDNSSLPVASGNETFANDDIAGVKYPRPKINWGPDGTANDVDVASGKPLPVQLRGSDGTDRSNSLPVVATNAGTFAVQDSRFATEDAAASADPVGPVLIAVRRDTLSTSEVSADGDNIALKATNKGKLHVAAELRSGDTVLDTGVGTGGSATLRVAMDTASQNANGQTTMANSTPVVIASDFTGTSGYMKKEDVASADGDAGVGLLAVRKATPANTSGTDGDYEFLQMSAGRLWASATIDAALPAGTNAIGKLAANAGVNIGDVSSQPSATGGLSVFRSLDLDESEEEVKATAGCLYKLRLTNRTTSARYVKLYNATAANVTVGTTTPIDTIVVPGGTSADLCTVVTESFGGVGLTFDTALCLAATTALADNDTGAPGANDVVATAYYK